MTVVPLRYLCVCLVFRAPQLLRGQTESDGTALLDSSGLIANGGNRGSNQLGVWLIVSLNSPFPTRLGTDARRDFYALGVQRAWTLASRRPLIIRYAVDWIPIATTSNNPNAYEEESCGPSPGECTTLRARSGTVVGTGASPLGLQVEIDVRRSVWLQLHGAAGILWFTHPVPDPDASRLNLTAQGGAAVGFAIAQDYSATIGFVRHHTSNGGRAAANPGLNANALFLAVSHHKSR
jgi:lipid A 3-O-deacylase PagL